MASEPLPKPSQTRCCKYAAHKWCCAWPPQPHDGSCCDVCCRCCTCCCLEGVGLESELDSRSPEEKDFALKQNERLNMKGDNGWMLLSLSLTGKYGQFGVSWTKPTSYSFTIDAEGVLSGIATNHDASTAKCVGILAWPAGSEEGIICWAEGPGKVMGRTSSIEAVGKVYSANSKKRPFSDGASNSDLLIQVDFFAEHNRGDARLTAKAEEVKKAEPSSLPGLLGAPAQEVMGGARDGSPDSVSQPC